MNNQKGITLVELLAAMVLLFIVSTLVLSVATQAIDNYRHSEERSFAQQEANLLINHLTSIHRTADAYQITRESGSRYVITLDGEETITVNGSPFQLDLELGGKAIDVGQTHIVDLSETESLPLTIQVVSQADQRFKTFELHTNLYRLTPANRQMNDNE